MVEHGLEPPRERGTVAGLPGRQVEVAGRVVVPAVAPQLEVALERRARRARRGVLRVRDRAVRRSGLLRDERGRRDERGEEEQRSHRSQTLAGLSLATRDA
jgi:hypothetical protein